MNYFKVGEDVILQSQMCPELNGEYSIREILRGGVVFYDEIRKARVRDDSDGIGYLLDEAFEDDGSGFEIKWHESSLRKKHKPSTESLLTIIEELNKVEA